MASRECKKLMGEQFKKVYMDIMDASFMDFKAFIFSPKCLSDYPFRFCHSTCSYAEQVDCVVRGVAHSFWMVISLQPAVNTPWWWWFWCYWLLLFTCHSDKKYKNWQNGKLLLNGQTFWGLRMRMKYFMTLCWIPWLWTSVCVCLGSCGCPP